MNSSTTTATDSSTTATSSPPNLATWEASIRAEMQHRFDEDQHILHLEREELQIDHDQLLARFQTLEQQHNAVLKQVHQQMAEAQLATSDNKLLRQQLEAVEETHKLLNDKMQQQETIQSMHAEKLNVAQQQLQQEQEAHNELKLKHFQLRETASNKLKAASQEYVMMRQNAMQAQEQLVLAKHAEERLHSELESLSLNHRTQSQHFEQLQEEYDKLLALHRDMQASHAVLSARAEELEQQCKSMEDTVQMNLYYKKQLFDSQNSIRSLQKELQRSSQAQQELELSVGDKQRAIEALSEQVTELEHVRDEMGKIIDESMAEIEQLKVHVSPDPAVLTQQLST